MQNYNIIKDTIDVSDESSPVTEPVTLQEMKNYLRLEGIGIDSDGIVPQEPVEYTLAEGVATITITANVTVLSLTRSGVGYSESDTLSNLRFTHNVGSGLITFDTVGNVGGEPVVVLFGTNEANVSPDAFDFDDDLIEEMITTARQTLEEKLGVSVVSHTWQAVGVANLAGDVQLQYGPVQSLVEVIDSDGVEQDEDDTKVIGDYLKKPRLCDMTVKYTAGYPTIPIIIVTEIKRMVAYMYENRGDVAGLDDYKYSNGALKLKRIAWLM